jgi:uncharacterized membrane protein
MTGLAAGAAASGFLAGLVEGVEALTVVLALGTVRGWRSPLLGVAAGLAALAVTVAAVGPALLAMKLGLLKLGLGVLLLLFGLRWLRKAMLRAAGVLAHRDETKAFAAAERRYASSARAAWDPVAFAAALQIVLLEGSEIIFIVIALGAGAARLAPPALGALAAVALVAALGVGLHRPVASLPENAVKMTVGVLLAAFGTFWTGEGLAAWPGGDWMLLALPPFWAAVAFAGVRMARA